MNLTKPKKPILTGVLVAIIISSSITSFYLLSTNFFVGSFKTEIQIPELVSHAFGTYNLPELEFTPSIIPTPIQPGLSNVNLQGLDTELTEEMKNLLEQYGFVIVDKDYTDIFEPMDVAENSDTPMFITTDLCFHVLHTLFDNCLKIIEQEYFYGNFSTMVDILRDEQKRLYNSLTDSTLKEAVKYNIAYLTVILYLIDPSTHIPYYVNSLVTAELENIENGLFAYSAIFNYEEDFSQYKARGHYTQNSVLEKYFQAMMYAGRIAFILDDDKPGNNLGIQQTRMAFALLFSFTATDDKNQDIWTYWDRICKTTSFLVGESDDLTPLDYINVWSSTENETINVLDLANDDLISEKIQELKEIKDSKISSLENINNEGNIRIIFGLRLFGQGYTPDAYIFNELTWLERSIRLIPNPLDILSVFGSSRAEYHLDEDMNDPKYVEELIRLRNEFGNLTISDWTQNVYWQWLYSLLPLLNEKGEGYPGFMRSSAWQDKELQTSLASWAQLKHDTILYAKQPYSPKGSGPELFHYVEPYPQIYSRIGATLRMLKEGLNERDLMYSNDTNMNENDRIYSDINVKFDNAIEIFDKLTEISIKELENEELSSSDLSFIQILGKRFIKIAAFNYGKNTYDIDLSRKPVLIADVFTETNSKQALEVAVGNPFVIYAIAQKHTGALYLTRGVTFSYYEFLHPSNDRLTNEQWREMLETNPPPQPSWITENIPIIGSSQSLTMVVTLSSMSTKKKITKPDK